MLHLSAIPGGRIDMYAAKLPPSRVPRPSPKSLGTRLITSYLVGHFQAYSDKPRPELVARLLMTWDPESTQGE